MSAESFGQVNSIAEDQEKPNNNVNRFPKVSLLSGEPEPKIFPDPETIPAVERNNPPPPKKQQSSKKQRRSRGKITTRDGVFDSINADRSAKTGVSTTKAKTLIKKNNQCLLPTGNIDRIRKEKCDILDPLEKTSELKAVFRECAFNKRVICEKLNMSMSTFRHIIEGTYGNNGASLTPHRQQAVIKYQELWREALREAFLEISPEGWSGLFRGEYLNVVSIEKKTGIPASIIRLARKGDSFLGADIDKLIKDAMGEGVEDMRDSSVGRMFEIALTGDHKNASSLLKHIHNVGIGDDGFCRDRRMDNHYPNQEMNVTVNNFGTTQIVPDLSAARACFDPKGELLSNANAGRNADNRSLCDETMRGTAEVCGKDKVVSIDGFRHEDVDGDKGRKELVGVSGERTERESEANNFRGNSVFDILS